MPRDLSALIDRYRGLVLEQARLRLNRKDAFRPFVCFLGPRENSILIDLEIDVDLRVGSKGDEAKDEVVEDIRSRAKKIGAFTVWIAVTGWKAPEDEKVRPSEHLKRRPFVLVFESLPDKDDAWLLPYGSGPRVAWQRELGSGGRFAGLLGGRRQIVDMDSYRSRRERA